MAFQNCSTLFFTLIVCIFLLITSKNAAVLAQNPLVFACDFEKNPMTKNFTFCDSSLDTKTRVDDLINRLTLQEKIIMLGNNQRNISQLGIPEYYWWSEALHGVASGFGNGGRSTFFTKLIPGATSFPQVILTAATFNKSLFQAIGRVVSTEARAMHNVGQAGLTFWSPNVNIFRDPRWGRGQETPGEDPYLSSTYGSAYVRGLQETDDGDKDRLKVAACCKHYTAYDLESWKGIDRFRFNAEVTKQDLADTFQPPFKSCVVDGNVASVMCSYNLVNGKPSCGDPDLLVGVVRGEWKLNGYISSDCDSLDTMFNQQHWTKTPEETVAAALHAGLDLNCGYWLQQFTESAVQKGLVNESEIDRAISNNLATLMRVGFFDGDPTKQMYGNLRPQDVCTSENRQLAREAAKQGIVLLKNSPGSLPLSPYSISSLAVIGPNANATDTMLGNYRGIPCGYTTPLQGLTSLVPTVFFNGCGNVTCSPYEVDIDGAKKVAATADAVVLIMGVDQTIEAEGLDRTDITLPGQQSFLVSEVANVSKGPVILVIMSGSGMDIQFAKDDPKITSILWAGYPGEAGGAALADIIFGYYSPSGRLPMTWYPQSFVDEVPMTNMSMRPDLATGYPGRTYRFYTGETVYDFSDGLSYTEFNYSFVEAPPKVVSLTLEEGHVCHSSKCKWIDVDELHCKDLGFEISVKITNVGEMRGSETVNLFSVPPHVHNAPQKQLLDFEKVMLEPQEEEVVKLKVDGCKDFSVADEDGNWKIALGTHVLLVGSLGIFVTLGI